MRIRPCGDGSQFRGSALLGAALISVFGAVNAASQESHVSLIPRSIQQEHHAIHALLVEATQEQGRIGAAARALAAVLHPHFVREEQIALPPLGLLRPLSSGELPAGAPDILAMTDTLRKEIPGMLEEHTRIRAAVNDLRIAAQTDKSTKYERLADQLALHALTEEEVLYPAAVLVGDIIRARHGTKRQ